MKCLHLYLGGKDNISYFYPIESYKGDTDPECQKLATARGFNPSFLAIVNYPPRGAHEVSHYTPKPEYYREQAEKIIPHYKEWEEVCLKISKQMNLAPFDAMEEFRLSAMRFYVEGLNKLFPVKTFCENIYKKDRSGDLSLADVIYSTTRVWTLVTLTVSIKGKCSNTANLWSARSLKKD